MYQYHNGGWVFIQSTRDLHVVENQVKEAQQGLDQAKADIINNKQKADADIENLNKSIEANKKTADESLQKLNDSVANLQGQYDNNIVPDLNKAATDVADALQKYIEAQKSITDLTKQAQQQGKDLADVTSTVNGLNINYASLAGDVNSTKVDVKGLQTTIGTANGDIAQLKLDAQNLQTMLAGKVDNTTYTNFVNLTNQALNARLTASDLNGYAKTVDVQATANGLRVDLNSVTQDIQNDLSQLSARIATTSQQFSSYYTKSETDSKANTAKNDAINAIKGDTNWTGLTNIITNSGFLQAADGFVQKVQQTTLPMFNGGGVNLLLNTQNFDKKWTWELIGHSFANGVLTLSGTNNGNSRMYQAVADGDPTRKTFSLSFNAKISADCDSQLVQVKAGPYDAPKWINITSKDSQLYKIENWQWAGQSGTFSFYVINGKVDISNLKLEYGSVATPWTPNPADLATQSAFSELSQSLEGLRSTVGSNYGSLQSQIDQTAKNIRQEVSDKTSGLQTQITQQANSFNVSLNALRNETAWQKVTTAIDANNYTTTGNYWIQAVSNSNTPDGSAWAYLEVVAEPAAERIKQTWQRDNNANEAYTRLKTGNTWSDWQKTVTAGNIMAQINMSAGTTLIQNNKIYMDADSTIFSGKAFIPSAAISNLSADKITTGTLNAGLINVINLNASSITTGTINGANLKIDLNNGEVQFKRGRITSIANTLNINIDTGTMSVTDGVNNGVYFANGELKLMDDPLNITGTPKYGGLRRSAHIWSPGSAGAELHSPNGVFVGSDNYNGAFAGGSGIDGTSSGAALAVDKDGSATLNGANIVSVSGGSAYDVGYSMKNRPAIILGKSQSGWNPGDRTFIQGAFVHIESAYRNTNGASPNVYVAPDGALVRSTSASKYKTDIQRSYVSDYGERLLELPTATWMDKAETERYVDGESQDKPVRHFGMIAEDLADAGLEMLVSRGQDGELEGIQYDRIGPALIPVIKQLQDKVNKLEEKLNER